MGTENLRVGLLAFAGFTLDLKMPAGVLLVYMATQSGAPDALEKKKTKNQEGVALLLSFPPWCSDAGQWRRSSRQKSCGSQLRSPNAFVGLAHAWWQGGTHQGLCPSNILRSGTPRICGALLEFTVNYIISMILASSQL